MGDDSHWQAYYRALYRVAIALGESGLEPAVVLRQLLQGVMEALGLRAASVRLLTKDGLLDPVAAEGLSPEYLGKGPVDVEHSGVDREALAGVPVVIEDVSADPRFEYPEAAKHEGIVSAAFVPLMAHGKPIGILRVYTGQRRSFSSDEIELLAALANLGALAITNARLYQVVVGYQQMTTDALWSFRLPDAWFGQD
ncbi:MAG: GAF domain-containing protein [Chloroflexi bacterium]|nr:GAF domain-containing protein [Chloroflexota bacterium]